jgi:hypothetical protein
MGGEYGDRISHVSLALRKTPDLKNKLRQKGLEV